MKFFGYGKPIFLKPHLVAGCLAVAAGSDEADSSNQGNGTSNGEAGLRVGHGIGCDLEHGRVVSMHDYKREY